MKITLKTRSWKDKVTGSWIVYSKQYDISGYGKTKSEAEKMISIIVHDILQTDTERINKIESKRKTRKK